MTTPWQLFLDDIREPYYVYRDSEMPELHPDRWTVARSTEEAKALILAKGMPELMSLDHDLGGADTTMVFLNWLVREHWNGTTAIPKSRVHSANTVGATNIRAFMDSWRKSTT